VSHVGSAVEVGLYSLTAALVGTTAVGLVLLPFGLSLVSLKTGLFVVGWLAFGVVAIRLFRGTVTTQTTAELSGFDRTLLRVPPLCLYWNEDTTPVSRPIVRQFGAALGILALSAALEFGLGVGT